MITRTLTLTNPTGLHARPAALFVQAAQRFPGTTVTLRLGDRSANVRSLLSVLALGAGAGSSVTIECEGTQEQEAMDALVALLEGGFGE